MLTLFVEHPASVGETYLEHLVFACRFGGHMVAGGIACCIHGLLPSLFTSTGSRTVLSLQAILVRKRPTRSGASPSVQGWPAIEPDYAI